MHVPDGFVPTAVLIGGYAITGLVTAYSLRKVNEHEDPRSQIPKAALLTAAFFIASAIRIPMPPPLTSAHLLMSGLMGVVLGYFAFPSILIGLILQFFVFGHGGITTIGVNAIIMGVPALLAHHVFQVVRRQQLKNTGQISAISFLAGALGVGLAVVIFYTIIINTIPADIDATLERQTTTILSISHVPIAILEGLFTAFLVNYLRRVKPELIGLTSPVLAK